MQVAKGGNSLAVRIPQVVEALELKDGDAGRRGLEVESARRKRKRARAATGAWRTRPEGWKFDREELYEERMGKLVKK